MARPTRTAKALAQRILDLDYFKKPHPLRRWRFLLSVAAPAVGVLWLAGMGIVGRSKPYTAGPLSPSHAFVAERCEVCHQTKFGFFQRAVRDEACLACHDGPIHHPDQVFTPSCTSCHSEHKGRQLAAISDAACTRCHSDLRTRQGKAGFVAVYGFPSGHPEFRPLRPGGRDPGTVKLNHFVHLKKDLKGPSGPVQMDCSDCHRPPARAAGPWPYGTAEFRKVAVAAAAPPDPLAPAPTRAYMAPINYAKHCAACHVLNFDPRFSEPAPHDKPQVVHDFLVQKFTAYLAAHPDAWHDDTPWVQRIPREEHPAPARNPQEWLTHRVGESERLLFGMSCKECHAVIPGGAQALPQVAAAQIPVIWLPHAHFDHEAHRAVACIGCHTRTPKSQDTADILIPSLATCQQCHRSMDPTRDSAADDHCSECHTYHDWSKEKPVKGQYTIPNLRTSLGHEGGSQTPAALLP